MAYEQQAPIGGGPTAAQAIGQLGMMGAAATAMAPAAAGAGTTAAAGLAALGPVGWAFLAVGVASTLFGMSASRKAEEYQRYQLKLADNQARIDAANTITDLSRDIRYTQGAAVAALGHTAAGIGESFMALRTDELNLYRRDISNARLSSGSNRATIQAASSLSRARQSNNQVLGYLSIASQGMNGYRTWTRVRGGEE